MKKLDLIDSIIFDTETTGLDDKAEIVEISLIDAVSGDVMYSSLVKPIGLIPDSVIDIHGITNDMVSDAPVFSEVWKQIVELGLVKNLISYNADYDTRLVIQSLRACAHKLPIRISVRCAMKWYAQFYGETTDWSRSYRWQSLVNACSQQNIDVSDLTAHRALADCEMTRRLIHVVNSKLGGV